MKLDTSRERLDVVLKLFNKAGRIEKAFRQNPRVSFGDVLGLMVMSEKLVALEDLIKTEMLLEVALEVALNEMDDVKDESKETRAKFTAIFGDMSHDFLESLLVKRIDFMISFADNSFGDRRMVKFQEDFREAMIAMRERYKEIYQI